MKLAQRKENRCLDCMGFVSINKPADLVHMNSRCLAILGKRGLILAEQEGQFVFKMLCFMDVECAGFGRIGREKRKIAWKNV